MQQPPATIQDRRIHDQAQRKFDKIQRKYFDPTYGQVQYVENLTKQNMDDDRRNFEWAFLLSEMRKDLPTMHKYKMDFPTISDPNFTVMHMHEYLKDSYYTYDPYVKGIYDSDDMQQKIRVRLSFQAGKKKEFKKWMSAGKIKLSSESTALQPQTDVNNLQKKYEKLGNKYFGDSAANGGTKYFAESQNAQQELEIQQAVLYNRLQEFQKFIENTPEIQDIHGYQEKLQTKINSMSPHFNQNIQKKAELRMAYEAGRKKEYFKLKMAGRLLK
jgi:hypothetical protein